MKPAIWHKLAWVAPAGIEVSRQRFMALLAVAGLAGIAVSLSQGSMMLFALILVAPLAFILLLSVINSPLVMFFAVFVFNYFMIGIMRYVNIDGMSVMMDILLWTQLLLIIMHKVLKGQTLYSISKAYGVTSGVTEAWVMSRRLIYQGLMMAVIVSLLFDNFRQVRWVIILYSILTLLAVAKALMQRFAGFDQYEMDWLISSESISTHIIHGGSVVRYFSFFTDAGNFGSNMGCAGIMFLLLAFYERKVAMRVYYAIVGMLAIYAMFLSGTRGAMLVPLAGLALYTVLSKNFKVMAIGGVVLVVLYVFFAHTYIGESNALIRRMRTAFHPTEDASFQVRMRNQAVLREYLKSKPFGEGIGLGGVDGRKYAYRVTTQIPNDSWYVKIWMETGIVGLILYVGILVAVLLRCSYIIMFKVKDKVLRGYLMAMLCGTFGMAVSAYGNAFLGQMPTMLLMYVFLGIAINGECFDKLLTAKPSVK